MYLKSLELQGFKSFPDKIKLDFNKGLTAVVGPNGSGKSNIGDAVRWVLGEQSSKTLRGGKMEDVIFAGTQFRKAVGFAAVTLNIVNDDRALNCDSDMVSVTRKLYRSGESEYLINGNQVRLKDIVELFLDTGLGKDGYSIIGQGRVADIVSSKSNERREIFEEAAGISKFRYKKAEAQRKLTAAEDNILRLNDIIGELEVRVEPLRIQSEKAHKYLKLAEERKSLEISVWMNKLSDFKKLLSDIEDKLLVCSSEYETLTKELEKIEADIDNCFEERQNCNMKAEELREQIKLIEEEKNESIRKIAVLENDIEHIKNTISSIEEQKKTSLSSNDKILADISEKQKELDELHKLDGQTRISIVDCENEFSSLNAQSESLSESLSDDSAQINELYIKKSEVVFSIENARKTIDESNSQISDICDAMSNIDTAIAQNESERKDASELLEELENQISEHSNKVSGYSVLLERKTTALDACNKEFSQYDAELIELTHKKKLLIDLENNMEGVNNSVKTVVKAGKNGQIRGICGSIAQIITVEQKYSIAIEIALGAQLQNIVVENDDTAKRCIKLLKDNNAGRATFLPLTSIKPHSLNENNVDMQEGFVAIANEIVSYDEKYRVIIDNLLGRTVIAEDIDCANVIAKKYGYRFRIVTLDGQVINSGGSYTGGSVSRMSGILTRRNEIDTISKRLEQIESKHAELKKRSEQLTAEQTKLRLDIEGEKELINTLNSDKIKAQSEYDRTMYIASQLDDSVKNSDEQIKSLKDKISQNEQLIKSSEKSLEDIIKQITQKEENTQDSQSKLLMFRNKREELTSKLSDLRLKLVEIEKDCEACNLYIDNQKKSLENLENDNTKYDELIAQNNELIAAKAAEIDAVKNSSDKTTEKIMSINSEITLIIKKGNEFEMQANQFRALEKNKSDEKETVSGELSRLTERKTTVSRDYDNIVSELWEQYQLSVTEAQAVSEPLEDVALANRQLNDLKNKIRNLGHVNVAAIDEYKEVSERYTFMSSQLKDIEVSKAELERLIENLTENMKTVFSECFEKINSNFKTIFVELFGGGKAELTLTEPDNILESGIEINVAPPGKVIKNLSLLSGGEQAFVAIAIYFAILKIKPSPFCILDEIEAALDDVNVTKYAAYLRNFTDTTQFILVTHRRGTMEEADVLYGVTMQEKGISKLLKLDVNDSFATENIT